jgi:hypothetical protein
MRVRWVRGAATVALGAAAASVFSGCTSPTAQFDQAIGQGLAAVETARLAVALELDEDTFSTVTDTALDDARRELTDASTTVSETDVTSTAEADLRAEALDALSLGVDAVNAALDAMAGIGSLAATARPLEEAADALEALEDGEDAGDPAS